MENWKCTDIARLQWIASPRPAREGGWCCNLHMVPVFLVDALRKQIAKVAELHREDLSGAGEVNLPFALSQSLLAATSRRSAISRPSCAESRSNAPELNRGQAGWIR
jgi:hypothetical protein